MSHSCLLPLQETLQHEQVGLVLSPMGSLLLFPGPGAHKTLCVPSKSGFSVSPSPVESLQSNPTGLQSQISWGSLVPLPDSQAEKPDMGLRTFNPMGELLWYNCFPVCGSLTQQVWGLILSQPCPSYCLVATSSLSLDVGYLFW